MDERDFLTSFIGFDVANGEVVGRVVGLIMAEVYKALIDQGLTQREAESLIKSVVYAIMIAIPQMDFDRKEEE